MIATLANQWGDCEAAAGYKDESWYTTATGYPTRRPATYREWVTEVVTRYRNDPTILAWQLVNEAEVKPSQSAPACSTGAAATLKPFATDMAGAGQVDRSRTTWSASARSGGGQCGARAAEYEDCTRSPTIDLCEYHDYQPTAPMPGDQCNGLQVRLDQCATLDKPLFVGETGIKPLGRGRNAPGSRRRVRREARGPVGGGGRRGARLGLELTRLDTR